MAAGEYLLLCTDGLVETVPDQEMYQAVWERGGGEDCLERLLELAKSGGAPDNVTMVLLRMD